MKSGAFIAVLIVGFGITGAYFILQDSITPTVIEIKTGHSSGNNLPDTYLITKPISENHHSAFPSNFTNSQNNNSLKNKNSTEIFFKGLGQKIAAQNPAGPEIIDDRQWLNAPNPEDLAQELIREATQKFDPKSLRPSIQDRDIKIASDNNLEAARKYLLAFNAIVQETANKFPSAIFTDPANLSMTTIRQLADIYQSGFDKFSQLETPPSLLEIHKKELELLGAKANIYKQIYSYDNDPITAFLAASELENIDKEFEALSETLDTFIQKNNINS